MLGFCLWRGVVLAPVSFTTVRRRAEARGWFERAVAAEEKGDLHSRVDPASPGRSLHMVGFCYQQTLRSPSERSPTTSGSPHIVA